MIDRFSDMQIIEWTGNMSASTLQVAIHDHSEEPNIMDSGYLVSPGYTTYMPIEVKEVNCFEIFMYKKGKITNSNPSHNS